jgi:hypothetical protein
VPKGSERDYVIEIIKALAAEKPIQEIGQRVLDEIDNDMRVYQERVAGLQQQVFTIRGLMQRYPDAAAANGQRGRGAVSTPLATPDVTTPTVGGWEQPKGLTEEQKLKIFAQAISLVRERGVKKHISTEEFLQRLASQGEHLENVQQPKAVAGSFLYRARERVKKNGQGSQGSLLKPAEAGES